jgi:Ser/Thr protein kinase RdoA (MazF antagonist)
VDGSYFCVVSYEKLTGEPIGDSLWNEILFRRWGALIGKLHRLSGEYVPKKRGYTWYESDFLNPEAYIPTADREIRNGAERVVQSVKDLLRVLIRSASLKPGYNRIQLAHQIFKTLRRPPLSGRLSRRRTQG